jgi:hypothetical protein
MAEDALDSFLRGELESYAMIGSGGRLCGRWRFKRSKEAKPLKMEFLDTRQIWQ